MSATKYATISNDVFWQYRRLFHSYAPTEAAIVAFDKALKTRPDVVPLPIGDNHAYAVARSEEGEWCVVQLAAGGSPEGAICTCPGGNHAYCYHRMAAATYHIKRRDALQKAVGLLTVADTVVEADPTTLPSTPARTSDKCERCKSGAAVEAKLCQDCLNEFWLQTYEQGCPVMTDRRPKPATTTSLFITINLPPAPATAGDPGPRCVNSGCGAELSRSNRGSKGYCVKCWAEKLRKDEQDMGF